MARIVLVVGGAGAFGSRLVRGLIETTEFDVVIAARDVRRAAVRIPPSAAGRARAIRLDTSTVIAEELVCSKAHKAGI